MALVSGVLCMLLILMRLPYPLVFHFLGPIEFKEFCKCRFLNRALPWAGENFAYSEAQESPNAAVAYLGSFALIIGYFIISLTFLRPLVMRLLPKPGEGPSKKQQVEGFWCDLHSNPQEFWLGAWAVIWM